MPAALAAALRRRCRLGSSGAAGRARPAGLAGREAGLWPWYAACLKPGFDLAVRRLIEPCQRDRHCLAAFRTLSQPEHTMSQTRTPEHDIHSLFLDRWSPRAFTGEPIDDATLLSFFEAARWAPSAYNSQPWRFLYAKNGTEHWPLFTGLLSEFNRAWAQNASALVILLSKTSFVPPGKTDAIPATTHAFDAGAAWANLALQASLEGWHTHAIGGYDKDKAREALGIPEGYALEAAIAIGKRGDKTLLSASLQEREQPSPRRPLAELVAEGGFAFA